MSLRIPTIKLPKIPKFVKRLAVLALIVGLVVGAGVLASNHYDRYQADKAAATATREQALTKELDAQKARNAELVKFYNNLRTECEKGWHVYQNAPAVVRAKANVPQPVCGPSIVK